jgi:hypothetical protein
VRHNQAIVATLSGLQSAEPARDGAFLEIGRVESSFFTLSRKDALRSVGRPCFFNKSLKSGDVCLTLQQRYEFHGEQTPRRSEKIVRQAGIAGHNGPNGATSCRQYGIANTELGRSAMRACRPELVV